MATLEDVERFLGDFKRKADESGLNTIPTQKNRDELAMTGLMPHERTRIVMELEPEDYSEGPMRDDDRSPGEVWVFGKVLPQGTIYIKLKLFDEAKCLSFHLADFTIDRPFKC